MGVGGAGGKDAVRLIPGLLLGGPLADRWGRRPLVLLALGTSALATCLLMAGPASAAFLWPGRFLTGIGAGALLAAGSAWIKELSSPPYGTAPNPGVAARRSGLFLSAGFATGGLAASLIAQWAPHPMVTAFVPHLILSAVAALCAARAPESSPAHPGKTSVAPGPGGSSAPRRPSSAGWSPPWLRGCSSPRQSPSPRCPAWSTPAWRGGRPCTPV
ncbi:MFS transporter [Streptomyces platensis]|uniref:MFS transporter n=1 Tax=Streptomyces platensis TaxID=58346 RepID=UPI0030E4916C